MIASRIVFLFILANTAGVFFPAPRCNADPPRVIQRSGPLRLQPKPLRGQASIPEGIVFDIVCSIDGNLMLRDWKAIGKIKSIGPDTIHFTTDEVHVDGKVRQSSHPATLAYRLPGGLKLDVAAGDPITILHDHSVVEKRDEWDIHISSGKKLILASSHRSDHSPPLSADAMELVFPGKEQTRMLFYWSDPVYNETDQKRDQELPSKIQLSVQAHQQAEPISQVSVENSTQIVTVTLDDVRYHLLALESEHSSHADHHDAGHQTDQQQPKHPDIASHTIKWLLIRVSEADRQ